MKVEKINLTNQNGASKLRVTSGMQTSTRNFVNPNFTGSVLQADLVKDLQKMMPRTIKVTNRLAQSMGEIQNIVINSLGTGLVAPIFIKYNPLSKTDEDTRTYSAWRQPISAILAVATQASMVAPFNNLINWMSNTGNLPDPYNKTNFQSDSYIRDLIHKTNPNFNKEQLDRAVAKEKTKQYNELLENLKNKNTIYIKQYNAPSKKMDSTTYKNLLLETIEDMLKDDNDKETNCKKTSEKRKIRSEFFRQHNDNAKSVLNDIKSNLESLNNVRDYKDYLSAKIKALKSENADAELIKMVKEIKERANIKPPEESGEKALMKEIRDKVSKMLKHADTYAKAISEEDVSNHVEKSLEAKKNALEISKKTLESLKNKINEGITVKDIEKLIADKVKENNITEDCSIKTPFSIRVIEKYKSNIESSLDGYKRFTGLIVSLAVLPITCCLLNWIYPIFMDAVFPNLSNKKHDNEASALVAKAPKTEEASR